MSKVETSHRIDPAVFFILAIMILQMVLLAGLLFRTNQVYVIVAGGGFAENARQKDLSADYTDFRRFFFNLGNLRHLWMIFSFT